MATGWWAMVEVMVRKYLIILHFSLMLPVCLGSFQIILFFFLLQAGDMDMAVVSFITFNSYTWST